MLIRPEEFGTEWRLVICTVLDFLAFKDKMLPKHQHLCTNLSETEKDLLSAKARQKDLAKLLAQHQKTKRDNEVKRVQLDHSIDATQTKQQKYTLVLQDKREKLAIL